MSDRAIRSLAIASCVESEEEGCRDDLEFFFGVLALDKILSCPFWLLMSFSESAKKTAVVLVDEPAPFKDWVQKTMRSNHLGYCV